MTEPIIAQRNPKPAALRQMANAMREMLRIGFKKRDLDWLEALWWEIHDDNGNIPEPTR